MEAASSYTTVKPILLHDPGSCDFPSLESQPPSVRHLFLEKAYTWIAGI